MLEGKCPKCGCRYTGWALRSPRNLMCTSCGAALEITEDGKNIFEGYSPFTAEKYYIDKPSNAPSPDEKAKGRSGQDSQDKS
ncbi:hypothetical protein ACFLXO_06985 [Chloroflexota bacterium]